MHYSMLKGEFITWHPVEYLRLQFLIISDHGFSLKVDLTPWINKILIYSKAYSFLVMKNWLTILTWILATTWKKHKHI